MGGFTDVPSPITGISMPDDRVTLLLFTVAMMRNGMQHRHAIAKRRCSK